MAIWPSLSQFCAFHNITLHFDNKNQQKLLLMFEHHIVDDLKSNSLFHVSLWAMNLQWFPLVLKLLHLTVHQSFQQFFSSSLSLLLWKATENNSLWTLWFTNVFRNFYLFFFWLQNAHFDRKIQKVHRKSVM